MIALSEIVQQVDRPDLDLCINFIDDRLEYKKGDEVRNFITRKEIEAIGPLDDVLLVCRARADRVKA